jgi:hypothetical protein
LRLLTPIDARSAVDARASAPLVVDFDERGEAELRRAVPQRH